MIPGCIDGPTNSSIGIGRWIFNSFKIGFNEGLNRCNVI